MLAVDYHIAYWVTASSAAAAYQLLIIYAPFTEITLRVVLVPVASYALNFSFTRHYGSKATGSALWMYQAAVACLLIAIGSVACYFRAPQTHEPEPTMVIHTLLAFMILDILESLRQNRRDIEPASFLQALRGPRSQLARFTFRRILGYVTALVVCDILLFGLLEFGDRLLGMTCGTSLRGLIPFYKQGQPDLQGRFGSAVVSVYLGGPFADMAETAFYAMCRRLVPERQGWRPLPGPLLSTEELFPLLNTEQGLCAYVWVIHVTLLCFWG